MHFSNTLCSCGQRLSGMSSCGLGCCEIIPMALIDVFGLLVMILRAVDELMIWLCFGDVQFLEPLWNVIMQVSILWGHTHMALM